jgi:hypothetical protein
MTIALSSTKVEYNIVVGVACEASWARRILKDIGV